jgi:ATP-binding cassette subfamily B protein
MGLVSMKEMLEKARLGHYAVGQFNINNLEWTGAILDEVQKLNAPVILGVSEGAARYMGGYNTIVGMDGVNLSSAQRQKLAIARALLKGSQILIFDEATSSIDNVSQSEIQDSINNLVNEKTIITISHRLSATSKCDRILVIDKGKIVAEGNHKNLITNCKVYKNLYKDVNKKIRF